MIKINVNVDIEQATRKLYAFQREQIPFARAVALTRTGQIVKKDLSEELASSFDAPTPFTRNSLFLTPATKTRNWAKVWIKDRQVKYLYPGIMGGKRDAKGFEGLLRRAGVLPGGWFAVPTKYAPKDAYGNVPGNVVVRILAQLHASRDSYQNETRSSRKRKGVKSKAARYFAALPGRSHLKPGIYERLSSSGVRPIFIFTPKTPTYRPRYSFYERGEAIARREFPRQFEKALAQALT